MEQRIILLGRSLAPDGQHLETTEFELEDLAGKVDILEGMKL